jgi:non-homologous end joining protein Ku
LRPCGLREDKESRPVSGEEIKLGRGLMEKLSAQELEPETYRDEYLERVLALFDEKAKGRQITVVPKRPRLVTLLI